MKEFLEDLEINARKEADCLENRGKLPAGFIEKHYPLTRREQLELRRLKAATAAATNVDVWLALVRGEAVPARMLNPRIVSDHKRRQRV